MLMLSIMLAYSLALFEFPESWDNTSCVPKLCGRVYVHKLPQLLQSFLKRTSSHTTIQCHLWLTAHNYDYYLCFIFRNKILSLDWKKQVNVLTKQVQCLVWLKLILVCLPGWFGLFGLMWKRSAEHQCTNSRTQTALKGGSRVSVCFRTIFYDKLW